jgi:hypothetical protein
MRIAMPIAALTLMTLGAPAQAFDELIALKVLYAGAPQSERAADFRSLLEGHFAKVGMADYLSLGAADTKDYDVVILDWPDLPPRDEKGFKRPALDRDPGRWRSWLEANRRRLYFTDIGGYKFLVAPEPLESSSVANRTSGEIPDAKTPIVEKAEISPAKVRAGEALELIVRVKLAPTWHIYAVGGSRGPGVPTTSIVTLPNGVEADSEWTCPQPVRDTGGQMIYQGTQKFRRRLRAAQGVLLGPIDLKCEFGYQACDPFSCRLPTKVDLTAKGDVRNSLGNNPVLPVSNG